MKRKEIYQDSPGKQQHNNDKQHRHPEKYHRAFGNHHVHGDVECTPEDDASHVEEQMLHVITAYIGKYYKIVKKKTAAQQ